jgi:hypothetical protein
MLRCYAAEIMLSEAHLLFAASYRKERNVRGTLRLRVFISEEQDNAGGGVFYSNEN